MGRTVSIGKCALCKGDYSKTVMSRHLKACQAEGAARARSRPVEALRLLVEGRHQKDYWLYLDVRSNATLADLDTYLRGIWLECCGHLSAFQIGGREYVLQTGGVDGMWSMLGMGPRGGNSMDVRVDKVLAPGEKFTHIYDFGTSTMLAGRVLPAGQAMLPKGARVQILARNLAPTFPCDTCGKPATVVCTVCLSEGEGRGCLCRAHSRKHACGEDMLMPLVNSPRAGMCGYTGPVDPRAYFNP